LETGYARAALASTALGAKPGPAAYTRPWFDEEVVMGAPELLIVLGVVVLLFGAKKLPDLARSIGRSTTEFKKGMQEPSADEQATPDNSEGTKG
jgi:TatA/E family protein of Tat protein translocase